MKPDVRAAHDEQQAAIPPDELVETDTTLGGVVHSGCQQHYHPRKPTSYESIEENDVLLDIISLSDGAM